MSNLELDGSGGSANSNNAVQDGITLEVNHPKRFFAKGAIEAYCGPREVGGPDDLEAVIIDFCNQATKTLRVAVQELDNIVIAQALIDAAWRGVSVQVFLEQDYLVAPNEHMKELRKLDFASESDLNDRQWAEHEDNNLARNREIFAALLRNGIDVKADYNPNIFHQKFIIRDYTTANVDPPPAVLTGSTNFTETGTHNNLNHIVIFHDKSIAYEYNTEFRQLRAGIFGRGDETRGSTKPKTHNLNGVPVRILFSPDNIPELEIAKQMTRAKHRIDYAIFTFSGSSSIDDVMVLLNRAEVKVRGVMERSQGNQEWAARTWLQLQGLEFYFPDKRDPAFEHLGKMHHKVMVIDDDIVIGGSMNYTGPANDYNDENIFVIGSPFSLSARDGGPVNHTFCAQIADFFRKEINRIIAHSDLVE